MLRNYRIHCNTTHYITSLSNLFIFDLRLACKNLSSNILIVCKRPEVQSNSQKTNIFRRRSEMAAPMFLKASLTSKIILKIKPGTIFKDNTEVLF